MLKLFLPIYNIRYSQRVRLSIKGFLRSILEGLDVEIEILGVSNDRRFVLISLTGKDALTAEKFLRREIGVSRTSIAPGERVSCRVVSVEEDIIVDAALEPYRELIIHSQDVIAGIIGKRPAKLIDYSQLITKLGISHYFPLYAVGENDKLLPHDDTIKMLRNWIFGRYERLIVYGATRTMVENAIKRAGLWSSIERVERLGFLEHAVAFRERKFVTKLRRALESIVPPELLKTVNKSALKRELRCLFL